VVCSSPGQLKEKTDQNLEFGYSKFKVLTEHVYEDVEETFDYESKDEKRSLDWRYQLRINHIKMKLHEAIRNVNMT
jgi:hypothetical protein